MRSEFQFINNIKGQFLLDRVGDDCAVLPKNADYDLLITADLLVEDIDFRLEWTIPEQIGHKALTVSLSDIAAMGGTPKWAMLSLGVPEQLWRSDFLDRFYDGWHLHARRSGVELVGGDISRSPAKLVVDSIVAGEVPKGRAILRSGARPGDVIVITDHVGGSAGGLKLLESGRRLGSEIESWEETLIQIHLQPWPQTGTGIYLMEHGLATAMIDISDGLAADLEHICNASNVGARLVAEDIPLNLNLRNLFDTFDDQLDLALTGGEDFQLLFTVPDEKVPDLSADLIAGHDLGIFKVIGEITENSGTLELDRNGKTEVLEPRGFRHF